MECMSPLSMFALSKLDMARMVQFLRALRLELVFLRAPFAPHFSSVASSEQSFNKFMKSVKYLQSRTFAFEALQQVRFVSVKAECPHVIIM